MKTQQGVTRFAELFMGLCEVFDKKYSPLLMDVYYQALNDFEFKQIEKVVNNIVKTCRFFPKPAEFVEAITGGNSALSDAALIQCDQVVRCISSIGAYRSIWFDDPVTNAVIQKTFGGWEKICDLPEEEKKWIRRDFMAAYESYSRSGIKNHEHLPGRIERMNNSNGYGFDDPVLIGNAENYKQPERIEQSDKVVKLIHGIGD